MGFRLFQIGIAFGHFMMTFIVVSAVYMLIWGDPQESMLRAYYYAGGAVWGAYAGWLWMPKRKP